MIFECIANLIESALLTWFFCLFHDDHLNVRRRAAAFLISTFILIMLINSIPHAETYGSFLLQTVWFAFLCWISPKKYWRNAVLAIIPYTVFGICNISFDLIASMLSGIAILVLNDIQIYYIFATLILQLMHFLVLKFLYLHISKFRYYYIDHSDYSLFFLLIMSLQISLIIAGGNIFPESFIQWGRYTILVYITFSVLLIFLLLNRVVTKNKAIQEERLANQILQSETDAANNLYEIEFKVRKMLHDIKHLASTVDLSDVDDETLTHYREIADELVVPPDTPSKMLNYVLYQHMIQAAACKIRTKLLLNISSEIPMEQSDFILLLSNILDNAIRHCGADKMLSIEMSDQNMHLRITVTNSLDNSENGADYTDSEDAPDHGYGILTIEQIVQKYKGIVKYGADHGEFTITVIIPYSD